jgi:hypothetical protein
MQFQSPDGKIVEGWMQAHRPTKGDILYYNQEGFLQAVRNKEMLITTFGWSMPVTHRDTGKLTGFVYANRDPSASLIDTWIRIIYNGDEIYPVIQTEKCSICGRIAKGIHPREGCIFGRMEKERAEEAIRLAKWRDDRVKNLVSGFFGYREEHPTVNTIVKCATDITQYTAEGAYGEYRMHLHHVLSFHGKGYMPALYRKLAQGGIEWEGNDKVYKTYDEAIEAGKKYLTDRVKRDNESWANFEAQQADIKRRKEAGEFDNK